MLKDEHHIESVRIKKITICLEWWSNYKDKLSLKNERMCKSDHFKKKLHVTKYSYISYYGVHHFDFYVIQPKW